MDMSSSYIDQTLNSRTIYRKKTKVGQGMVTCQGDSLEKNII